VNDMRGYILIGFTQMDWRRVDT